MSEYREFSFVTDLYYGILDLFAAASAPVSYPKHEHIPDDCRQVTYFLLIGDQLDARFFYIMRLFQSSTSFEQTRAHHQEVNCINTASGIVARRPVCRSNRFLLDLNTGHPLTESDYTRCCINTINLLMMITCLFETCRGMK
jgi:hypothetical protein